MNVRIMKPSSRLSLTALGLATVASLVLNLGACTNKSAKATPNYVIKDAPTAGVVAKINGQDVTEEELIGDEKATYLDMLKREYEFKMQQLNKLVVDRVLGAEAKKDNLSLDEYIKKNITKGEIKISDADYKKFVTERKIPEAQIDAKLKERIHAFLTEQKREEMVQATVNKLTKSNPVEVYFKKPKMNIQVDLGEGSPRWGDDSAKVKVVEFSDFQCPFCSKGAEVVNELKKKYKGKIQVIFRHVPLPMHSEAKNIAESSMCVNEQSSDKFWKFHDIVFKGQANVDKASLEKYAKESGADVKKYNECVEAKKYADYVAKDMAYAEKLGVRSTPTFFINGQLVAGALPVEQFSEIIDEELAAK